MDTYKNGLKHGFFATLLCVSVLFGVFFALSSSEKKATPEGVEQKFGGTTTSDSLKLKGTLTVDGATTLSGNVTQSGSLTVTGTSTLSGNVGGAKKTVVTTMSSSATTTACAMLNSSGSSRIVTNSFEVDRGTAASLGAIQWKSGTSTSPGVSPTVSVVNSTLTRVSGLDIITTTSTAQTLGILWRSGEYWVDISSTTTNAGTCRLEYISAF